METTNINIHDVGVITTSFIAAVSQRSCCYNRPGDHR